MRSSAFAFLETMVLSSESNFVPISFGSMTHLSESPQQSPERAATGLDFRQVQAETKQPKKQPEKLDVLRGVRHSQKKRKAPDTANGNANPFADPIPGEGPRSMGTRASKYDTLAAES